MSCAKIHVKTQEISVNRLISEPANDSMLELQVNNKIFKSFSYTLDSVDMTFQSIFVPKDHFRTKMVYYLGAHAAYSMKSEATEQPTGLASFISNSFERRTKSSIVFAPMSIIIYLAPLSLLPGETRMQQATALPVRPTQITGSFELTKTNRVLQILHALPLHTKQSLVSLQ